MDGHEDDVVAPPSLASSDERHVAPHVELRHNRNFRLLWIGQVLSDLGSQFGVLAYPLLILELTGKPVLAGAVATIASIAAFVVRLPAGALSDRWDRRRTMLLCDGIRAVVLAGFAVAVVLHVVSWPAVLVVAVIDTLGNTLFNPSSNAILATIVASEQLEDAWAATEARQFAAGLGGPAIGGILFRLGAAVPFVGDAVSYGVSTLTTWSMRGAFASKQVHTERRGLWSEAFEGIRTIWGDPILRAVVVQAPLINFLFTGILVTVTLSLRVHGTSSTLIGFAQAGIMAGGLLGAIAAPRLQGRFSLTQLLLALTGGGAVAVGIAAVLMPSPIIAVPIALPFFVSPIANASLFAAMLRQTPEELRGRVNNALIQLATGLATLSPLVVGVLVANVSAAWTMGFFAVGLAIAAVLARSLRGLRLAELSAAA